MGLINIVQNGKQRFFLPEQSPSSYLEPVLALYPPKSTDIDFLPELRTEFQTLEKEQPAELPEWLLEPDANSIHALAVPMELPGVFEGM